MPTSQDTSSKVIETKSGMDKRQFTRRSVLWPAHVVVGRHSISCQVWNLSLGGARIRIDLPLKEGTDVILSLPGRGDLKGQIAWVEKEATGIRFHVAPNTVKRMFKDRLHVLGLDADVSS